MDTVVNKLLDVDKQARVIIDEARQYYDRTLQEIETEKKRLTDEYEQKASKHFEDIKNSERESVADASAEVKKRYARLTLEMDDLFDQNRARWEDEIFNKCLGR